MKSINTTNHWRYGNYERFSNYLNNEKMEDSEIQLSPEDMDFRVFDESENDSLDEK